MKKISKLKIGLATSLSLFLIVSLLGVGLFVRAYSGQAPKVLVEGNYIEAENNNKEDMSLGAISGPHVYGDLYVHGRFMQGKQMLATSTAGAADVMEAEDLMNYSGYDYTPTGAAVTLTTMASTTLSWMNAGECFDFRHRNLSPTSASSTTIAAGTGIDMVENENGDVVIEGGNEAQMKFCKELDTDVTLYVDEYIAAD